MNHCGADYVSSGFITIKYNNKLNMFMNIKKDQISSSL